MGIRKTKKRSARTAGGSPATTELLRSAEQEALAFLRERTEEGHLRAGRTPPSRTSDARTSGPRQIDTAIRDDYLLPRTPSSCKRDRKVRVPTAERTSRAPILGGSCA